MRDADLEDKDTMLWCALAMSIGNIIGAVMMNAGMTMGWVILSALVFAIVSVLRWWFP